MTLCLVLLIVQDVGQELDRRTMSLAGEPSWIRSNLTVFSKKSTVTSHDWLQLVAAAGDFLFAGLFPGHPL